MEMVLFTGIVSFSMPATPKGLVTTLKLVIMVSMRLPESETMKMLRPAFASNRQKDLFCSLARAFNLALWDGPFSTIFRWPG
jgi:hypothetical protein